MSGNNSTDDMHVQVGASVVGVDAVLKAIEAMGAAIAKSVQNTADKTAKVADELSAKTERAQVALSRKLEKLEDDINDKMVARTQSAFNARLRVVERYYQNQLDLVNRNTDYFEEADRTAADVKKTIVENMLHELQTLDNERLSKEQKAEQNAAQQLRTIRQKLHDDVLRLAQDELALKLSAIDREMQANERAIQKLEADEETKANLVRQARANYEQKLQAATQENKAKELKLEEAHANRVQKLYDEIYKSRYTQYELDINKAHQRAQELEAIAKQEITDAYSKASAIKQIKQNLATELKAIDDRKTADELQQIRDLEAHSEAAVQFVSKLQSKIAAETQRLNLMESKSAADLTNKLATEANNRFHILEAEVSKEIAKYHEGHAAFMEFEDEKQQRLLHSPQGMRPYVLSPEDHKAVTGFEAVERANDMREHAVNNLTRELELIQDLGAAADAKVLEAQRKLYATQSEMEQAAARRTLSVEERKTQEQLAQIKARETAFLASIQKQLEAYRLSEEDVNSKNAYNAFAGDRPQITDRARPNLDPEDRRRYEALLALELRAKQFTESEITRVHKEAESQRTAATEAAILKQVEEHNKAAHQLMEIQIKVDQARREAAEKLAADEKRIDAEITAFHKAQLATQQEYEKKVQEYEYQTYTKHLQLTLSAKEFAKIQLDERYEAYEEEINKEIRSEVRRAAVIKQLRSNHAAETKQIDDSPEPHSRSLNTQRYAAEGAAQTLGMAFMQLEGWIREAMKASGEYDEALRHFNSIAHETQEQLGITSGILRQMSLETPRSAKDLAEGLYEIQGAGLKGALGLDTLKVAAMGAVAGNTDLKNASKALTGEMDAFNLRTGPDALRIMNSLFQMTADGQIHFEELAGHLGYVTTQAANMKIPFEQLHAMLSTLVLADRSFAQATQETNMMLNKLQHPTIAGAAFARSLGLEWFNTAHSMRHINDVGLPAALQEINKATGGSAVNLRLLLGDTMAARAAQILLRNDSERLNVVLQRQAENVDALTTAYAENFGSFTNQAKLAQNAINDIITPMGDALNQVFVPLVYVLGGLAEGFNKLPVPLQEAGGAVGALALGLVGVAFGAAVAAAGGLAMAAAWELAEPQLVKMGVTATGTTLSLEALGTVAWATAGSVVGAVGTIIGVLFDILVPIAFAAAAAVALAGAWDADFAGMRTATEGAVTDITAGLRNIAVHLGFVDKTAAETADNVSASLDFMTGATEENAEEQSTVWRRFWTILLSMSAVSMTALEGILKLVLNSIASTFVVFWDFVSLNWTRLGKDLATVWGLNWENMSQTTIDATTAMWNRLKQFATGAQTILKGIFQSMAAAVTGGDDPGNFLTGLNMMNQGLAEMKGSISFSYHAVGQAISSSFTGLGDKLIQAGANVMGRFNEFYGAINERSGGMGLGAGSHERTERKKAGETDRLGLPKMPDETYGLPNVSFDSIETYSYIRRMLTLEKVKMDSAKLTHEQRLKNLKEFQEKYNKENPGKHDKDADNLIQSKINAEEKALFIEANKNDKAKLKLMQTTWAAEKTAREERIKGLKQALIDDKNLSAQDIANIKLAITKQEDLIGRDQVRLFSKDLADHVAHLHAKKAKLAEFKADMQKLLADHPEATQREKDDVQNKINAAEKAGHARGGGKGAARKAEQERLRAMVNKYKDAYEKIVDAAKISAKASYDARAKALADEAKGLKGIEKLAFKPEEKRQLREKLASIRQDQATMADEKLQAEAKMDDFLEEEADKRMGGAFGRKLLKNRQQFLKEQAEYFKHTPKDQQQSGKLAESGKEYRATRDQTILENQKDLDSKLKAEQGENLEWKLNKNNEYYDREIAKYQDYKDEFTNEVVKFDKERKTLEDTKNAKAAHITDEYYDQLVTKNTKVVEDILSMWEKLSAKHANIWEKMKAVINTATQLFHKQVSDALGTVIETFSQKGITGLMDLGNAWLKVGQDAIAAGVAAASQWLTAIGPGGWLVAVTLAAMAVGAAIISIFSSVNDEQRRLADEARAFAEEVEAINAKASKNRGRISDSEYKDAKRKIWAGGDAGGNKDVDRLNDEIYGLNGAKATDAMDGGRSQAMFQKMIDDKQAQLNSLVAALNNAADSGKADSDKSLGRDKENLVYDQRVKLAEQHHDKIGALEIKANQDLYNTLQDLADKHEQGLFQTEDDYTAARANARLAAAAKLADDEDQLGHDHVMAQYDMKLQMSTDLGEKLGAVEVNRLKDLEDMNFKYTKALENNDIDYEQFKTMSAARIKAINAKAAADTFAIYEQKHQEEQELDRDHEDVINIQAQENLTRQRALGQISVDDYQSRMDDIQTAHDKAEIKRMESTVNGYEAQLASGELYGQDMIDVQKKLEKAKVDLSKAGYDGMTRQLEAYKNRVNQKYQDIEKNLQDQKTALEDLQAAEEVQYKNRIQQLEDEMRPLERQLDLIKQIQEEIKNRYDLERLQVNKDDHDKFNTALSGMTLGAVDVDNAAKFIDYTNQLTEAIKNGRKDLADYYTGELGKLQRLTFDSLDSLEKQTEAVRTLEDISAEERAQRIEDLALKKAKLAQKELADDQISVEERARIQTVLADAYTEWRGAQLTLIDEQQKKEEDVQSEAELTLNQQLLGLKAQKAEQEKLLQDVGLKYRDQIQALTLAIDENKRNWNAAMLAISTFTDQEVIKMVAAWSRVQDAINATIAAAARLPGKPGVVSNVIANNLNTDTSLGGGGQLQWTGERWVNVSAATPSINQPLQPYRPMAKGGKLRGGIKGMDSIPLMAMEDELYVDRSLTSGLENMVSYFGQMAAGASASNMLGSRIQVNNVHFDFSGASVRSDADIDLIVDKVSQKVARDF